MASFSWARLDISEWFNIFRNVSLLLLTQQLLYQNLLQLKLIKPTRWENQVITSLILFLLFDPLIPWYYFPLLAFVTEIVQRFIRVPTGPVFNPAAFGTLFLSLLSIFPGWWGVSFSPRLPIVEGGVSISMLLIAPFAVYVAHKYKKLHLIVSALICFSFAYLFAFGANPLFLLIEGTLAFFFLVMVAEPKTSPVLKVDQYVYGGAVGMLTVIGLYFGWLEAYVIALLIANLGWQLWRNRARFFISQTPQISS